MIGESIGKVAEKITVTLFRVSTLISIPCLAAFASSTCSLVLLKLDSSAVQLSYSAIQTSLFDEVQSKSGAKLFVLGQQTVFDLNGNNPPFLSYLVVYLL